MRRIFDGLPGINRLEVIGSPRNRLIVILLPIFALLIPLGQSFGKLQGEFSSRQRDAQIRAQIQRIWEDDFKKNSEDEALAYIDALDITEDRDSLGIQMRVFTSEPFDEAEQKNLEQRFMDGLDLRDRQKLTLNLVQIETSQRTVADTLGQLQTAAEPEIKSIDELQSELWQALNTQLQSLYVPDNYQILDYRAILGAQSALMVEMTYLGDRPLNPDAQDLLQNSVKQSLNLETAEIALEFINRNAGSLIFDSQFSELSASSQRTLDQVAQILTQHPTLSLKLTLQVNEAEDGLDFESLEPETPEPPVDLRVEKSLKYLELNRGMNPNRLSVEKSPKRISIGSSSVTLWLQHTSPEIPVGGAELEANPAPPPNLEEEKDTSVTPSPNGVTNSDREDE